MTTSNDRAVAKFRQYIQIKSVPPTPDYAGAVKFIIDYLKEFDIINVSVVEPNAGFPIVLATVPGKNPSLPSVLLNSHMDVVPVEEDSWLCDPFSGHMTDDGKIYGRGTQDMKCVTIQYIEALGRMLQNGAQFERTLHLSFVPDEELGGHRGIRPWIATDAFKALNVGVALDEGLANPTEKYTVFYGERSPWWVRVTAKGNVGHGSRFIEGAALDKLHAVCGKFLAFRAEQKALWEDHDKCKTLGDVTTVNLTNIKGGIGQINVVPASAEACFDIRISPKVNLDEFRKQLDDWTDVEGVSYELVQHLPKHFVSTIDPNDMWWKAFMSAFDQLGVVVEPEIFPAATDSRYLRELGIPAYGFSPMNNTPILLHDHNEYLHRDIFLHGIDVFQTLITNMANAK